MQDVRNRFETTHPMSKLMMTLLRGLILTRLSLSWQVAFLACFRAKGSEHPNQMCKSQVVEGLMNSAQNWPGDLTSARGIQVYVTFNRNTVFFLSPVSQLGFYCMCMRVQKWEPRAPVKGMAFGKSFHWILKGKQRLPSGVPVLWEVKI